MQSQLQDFLLPAIFKSDGTHIMSKAQPGFQVPFQNNGLRGRILGFFRDEFVQDSILEAETSVRIKKKK